MRIRSACLLSVFVMISRIGKKEVVKEKVSRQDIYKINNIDIFFSVDIGRENTSIQRRLLSKRELSLTYRNSHLYGAQLNKLLPISAVILSSQFQDYLHFS